VLDISGSQFLCTMADGLTLPDVPATKTINYADQSIKTIDIVCQWHPALYRHPWGDKECRFLYSCSMQCSTLKSG